MSRYVALGSSMAAGPGIRPTAEGAPFRAARSARNYPHLVAERLGYNLVDVTYSGATTANVLTDPQHGAPPPPRQPQTPDAGWCGSRMQAATITPGRPNLGRRSTACRFRVDPHRCIPTPPACGWSPTWSPPWPPEIMGR
jgi:hypothetical protein